MSEPPKLSLVIAAKSYDAPDLQSLLEQIELVYAHKKYSYELETIVITSGTSESAKALGVRTASGKYICFLASDNVLLFQDTFERAVSVLESNPSIHCAYPSFYGCDKRWPALSRYFAYLGGNDVLSYYLGKNDRRSCFDFELDPETTLTVRVFKDRIPSMGDNGFFIRKDLLLQFADLDHYYHIDGIEDVRRELRAGGGYLTAAEVGSAVGHLSGVSPAAFMAKRFRYAKQHAFSEHRRWHLYERADLGKLLLFIFYSVTLVQPLWLAIRGYLKVRDWAWILHPMMCLLTVLTYGVLMISRAISRVSRSFSAPTAARIVSTSALPR